MKKDDATYDLLKWYEGLLFHLKSYLKFIDEYEEVGEYSWYTGIDA